MFVLVGAVWATAIHTLTTPKRIPVTLRPEAVAWGDRVFTSRVDLAAWLASRGLSYRAWERRHPAGLQILIHPHARAVPRPAPAASPTKQHVSTLQSVLVGGRPSHPGAVARAVLITIVVFGLAFALIVTLRARTGLGSNRLLATRIYAGAAAGSAAIALLIARLIA
jgi:hypothetical protein